MSRQQVSSQNSEVPEGYKQTEVGLIPEDWECTSLNTISRLSSGTTPSRVQEDRYYKDGEYYGVKTTDINNTNGKPLSANRWLIGASRE